MLSLTKTRSTDFSDPTHAHSGCVCVNMSVRIRDTRGPAKTSASTSKTGAHPLWKEKVFGQSQNLTQTVDTGCRDAGSARSSPRRHACGGPTQRRNERPEIHFNMTSQRSQDNCSHGSCSHGNGLLGHFGDWGLDQGRDKDQLCRSLQQDESNRQSHPAYT